MKRIETEIMGMPITVEVLGKSKKESNEATEKVFGHFRDVDAKFSTYKNDSEISKINRYEIKLENASEEMREVFDLSEETKKITNGFFDIKFGSGNCDPSGMVKGWAIFNASKILEKEGFTDFYIDAGGDIQTSGKNSQKEKWSVGIRNPFNTSEIVKVLALSGEGVATSGSYERGNHIYNPINPSDPLDEVLSLTVIGPNIYEADRFATAAFAMGAEGINFIENLSGFEGYQISKKGIATKTSNFEKYAK